MERITLFTWGYWGWGHATKEFIKAVDTVEAARGYARPMFVDIRLSRSVRAPGFNGAAFEHTVGKSRYRWMESLGNLAIKEGGTLRIKDPTAAETLLDIAVQCAQRRQRILFFCACKYPGVEHVDGCHRVTVHVDGCHRVTVARLVLEAANRRKLPIEIVKWPGGEPRRDDFEVQLSASDFRKVRTVATTVPLEGRFRIAEMASVPWCSQLVVAKRDDEDGDHFRILTGPAQFKNGKWCLPLCSDVASDASANDVKKLASKLRQFAGFEARRNSL